LDPFIHGQQSMCPFDSLLSCIDARLSLLITDDLQHDAVFQTILWTTLHYLLAPKVKPSNLLTSFYQSLSSF
jgi:hypothetical protein